MRQVFVPGLDPSVTREDLEAVFGDCGTFIRVKISTPAPTALAFAHVTFADTASTDKVLLHASPQSGIKSSFSSPLMCITDRRMSMSSSTNQGG